MVVRLPDSAASRAVLIGTSSYTPGSGFDDLPAVAGNLAAFSQFLQDQTGLPRANIHVTSNPQGVDAFIDTLSPAAGQATDMLLFYFAGHGVALPDNDLGLTCAQSQIDHPAWNTAHYNLIRH